MPINPTESQSETSRVNGQKSHGPVTPEGKAISSKNAFKFGFYAKSPIAPGETQEEYDLFCAQIRSSYECRTGHEEIQLDSLCDTQWAIKRCMRLLAAVIGTENCVRDSEIITQQRERLERIKVSTMKQLSGAIRDREAEEQKQLDLAAIVRRADKKAGRESCLDGLGFEFKNEEVDQYIIYQDVIRVCKEAILGSYAGPRQ